MIARIAGVTLAAVLSVTLAVSAPARGTWAAGQELPTPRSELAAVELDGRLYALGGGGGDAQRANEVWDPASWTWQPRAPPPRALNHLGAAAVNGRLYVFGGEDPTQTYADAFAFDPLVGAWGGAAPMPTARHGPGAATLAGAVHVIGGGTAPGGGSDTSVHEILTP